MRIDMRLLVDDGSGRKPLEGMSYAQARQAAAIVDCIGRLIPQEGVDYDAKIIFKGEYDANVSLEIEPHTDKGEWWREYVMKMIKKYPPTVKNPEPSIPIDPHEKDEEYSNEESVP